MDVAANAWVTILALLVLFGWFDFNAALILAAGGFFIHTQFETFTPAY